jgi:hypothetical protein
MSTKASLTGRGFAFAITTAGIFGVAAIIASTLGFAQTTPNERSVMVTPNSREALRIKEPHFEVREVRLAARPLDWNAPLGKLTPRKYTPEELEELRAPPQSSEGGRPDPRAEAEARRLHPEDWK